MCGPLSRVRVRVCVRSDYSRPVSTSMARFWKGPDYGAEHGSALLQGLSTRVAVLNKLFLLDRVCICEFQIDAETK